MMFAPNFRFAVLSLLLLPPLWGCKDFDKPFAIFKPSGSGGGGGLFGGPTDEDLWAVRCLTAQGPQQFQISRNYADALKKVQGLKPNLVQVFSDDEGTTIYYGKYRREYDAATKKEKYSPDPLPDLNLIRQLSMMVNGQPVWPFYLASLDSLPSAQAEHPEWDLAKADGHWSLQVAVFYNQGEFNSRKKAAIEYCKDLRSKGEQAYYHHGPANSSVCVGLFPEEAIVTTQREDPLSGVRRPVSRIEDERLLALQKKYPSNLENGHQMFDIVRDPATGQIRERVPRPSFPVKTPRAEKQPEGKAGRPLTG